MSLSIPIIKISAYNTAEIASPAGNRHLPGGSFAFLYLVSSGCKQANPLQPATTSGTLNFLNTTFDVTNGITPPYLASKPMALTINLGSSGVGIGNMALYLTEDSALKASQNLGLDPGFVQMTVSGIWQPNCVLPSGAGQRLTRNIPLIPTIKRQDGGASLVGEDDPNSSQFIYLNLILPFGFPIGNFGCCGSGNLRFGLIFDYFPNDYILQFGDVG